MKYFIVDGNFAKPIEKGPAFMEVLKRHHAFTGKGVDEGWILFCGPKPTGGGVFVAKAESQEELEAKFENDPFKTEGINIYTFSEFKKAAGQPEIVSWFE